MWPTGFSVAAAIAIAAVVASVYRRRSKKRLQEAANPPEVEMSDLKRSPCQAMAEENVYQVIA